MNAFRYQLSILCNICLCLVLLMMVAVLIEERSKDVIRFKVSSDEVYGYELGPTVAHLQAITGKEAYAVPLNGNNVTAKRWQVRFK